LQEVAGKMGARRAIILFGVAMAVLFLASGLLSPEPSAQTTSPDGKIVYVKQDTEPGEHLDDIWVMDADGTNKTNLTDTPDFLEYQPSWAPSGAQLTFVREVPGRVISEQPDIFVMDANGENASNLTQTDESESGPDWSPDGAKIAFAGVRDSGWEILTTDPDGQNETILTGDGFDGNDEAPDWSPDGTKVVFMKQSQVGGCCEPWEIWAVNRDGSGDTNLTNHPRDDTGPSWSPDGSEITFSSNRNADASGESDIYAMPAPATLPPPDETASATTSQDSGGAMDLAAGDVMVRAASAQTISETTVRRLTTDGGSTEPDWGRSGRPACTIEGTSGADTLTGTSGPDVICSRGGNDTINGMGGDDTLVGNEGSDTLLGGGANDTLKGGKGRDALIGGSGKDNHNGGNHNDQLDSMDGVGGNDVVVGGGGVDTCLADVGDKVGTSCEQ
jgi:Ca2+-binding RTX toxin-like protein